MNEAYVSMSELRQRIGDLVNRAAYGGERIVLLSHGQPKAAIIGVEDLRRLQELNAESKQVDEYAHPLAVADRLREKIYSWQQSSQAEQDDSIEVLRRLREVRDEELGDLR